MILNPPTPDKIYRESQDSTFQTIIPGKQPKLGLTHGHGLLMYMHSPVGALQNNTLSEIIYLFITPHAEETRHHRGSKAKSTQKQVDTKTQEGSHY